MVTLLAGPRNSYAAQFPTEVEKLVVMDAFLPGVEGWKAVYDNPALWLPIQWTDA
jgi:hypothetical protein